MKTLRILVLCVSLCAVNSQTYFTGGGCAEIPKIGSPILMIADAHQFIEDSLDTKNKHTVARYVFFESTISTNRPGVSITKLIFEINSYSGKMYLAAELEAGSNSIGGTRFNKFMMSKDLGKVGSAFSIANIAAATDNVFNCGDLKYIYSSYGRGNSSQLSYLFPGRNQNRASQSILDRLRTQKPQKPKRRLCVTMNYVKTVDFYGSIPPTPPVNLINCLPDRPGIAAISINCNSITGRIRSLRMIYNRPGSTGVTFSNLIGDPTAPISDNVDIDLRGADKIQLISYFAPGVDKAIHINTLDTNNQLISTYNCGSFTGGTRSEIIAEVGDFLGFSDVQLNAAGIVVERLEVTTYSP